MKKNVLMLTLSLCLCLAGCGESETKSERESLTVVESVQESITPIEEKTSEEIVLTSEETSEKVTQEEKNVPMKEVNYWLVGADYFERAEYPENTYYEVMLNENAELPFDSFSISHLGGNCTCWITLDRNMKIVECAETYEEAGGSFLTGSMKTSCESASDPQYYGILDSGMIYYSYSVGGRGVIFNGKEVHTIRDFVAEYGMPYKVQMASSMNGTIYAYYYYVDSSEIIISANYKIKDVTKEETKDTYDAIKTISFIDNKDCSVFNPR